MNNNNDNTFDRFIDLTLAGESPSESEFAALAKARGYASTEDMALQVELAATEVMLATSDIDEASMPDRLREKVLVESTQFAKIRNTVTSLDARRSQAKPAVTKTNWAQGLGWAAAAALLIALIIRPSTDGTSPAAQLQPVAFTAEQSLEALRTATGTVTLPWATPESIGYESVTGEVIWNDEEQKGFLRLANMPANNPLVSQYQLWIVDPDRDSNPVDGGVFDIVADNSEVLIPIDAKLPVIAPAAFAITREQPGGVVVSKGPLLVIAAAS